MKKACMSNVKDPENRSKKNCICGCHSTKAKNRKRSKLRRIKPLWTLEDVKKEGKE